MDKEIVDKIYANISTFISSTESTWNKCGANMKFDFEKDLLECPYCNKLVLNATKN